MRFSQRIGKRPVKTVLQVDSMDDDLRNRLWNVTLESFFDTLSISDGYGSTDNAKVRVCKYLWKEFYRYIIDDIPQYSNGLVYEDGVITFIKKWFLRVEWYEVYDFIEFISVNPTVAQEFNKALIKEVSGYRIVSGRIVQVTSEEEIQEIEQAITETDNWKSVNTHLQSALNFLADKKTPDYRNSIKESISAVESLCAIITKNSSATLGQALSEIEKTHSLHKALKTSFSALYGYTSDAGGIRHALLEDSLAPSFEDAKFMLVSCSTFINYLKSKMNL
ncbi:hypothetical protein D3C87_592720 [compost metagenome]